MNESLVIKIYLHKNNFNVWMRVHSLFIFNNNNNNHTCLNQHTYAFFCITHKIIRIMKEKEKQK